jgi:D-tyrosyl-tRNA(Tyr) deacylase
VEEQLVHRIGAGLLIFLGVGRDDTEKEAFLLAEKVTQLRIFADENGRMNRSVLDVGGELLVVSQFTLYGDTQKGTRPSFSEAAPASTARYLYEEFIRHCEETGVRAGRGVFQAHMKVQLVNDGPVTLLCSCEHSPRRSW